MKDVRWRCSREEKYYDRVISAKIEKKRRESKEQQRKSRGEKKRRESRGAGKRRVR